MLVKIERKTIKTMTESLHYRTACLEDIPALCQLLEALFTLETDFQPDSEKQARALARLIAEGAGDKPLSQVWVAEAGARVIGMCTVQIYISTAEGGRVGLVEDVIVAEDYRGRGIGRAMLAKLEQWAQHQGLLRLQLLADRHNQRALAFYQRHGWQQTQLVALRKPLID